MSVFDALKSSYDAVVIGARCAGASTALLLARQGLSVLAIDRSRYGSDTLSTLALMRGGVLQLQRWGVLDAVRAAATPPVVRTRFRYGDEVVEVAIKPRDGVEALYAPRRTVLDRVLADAAGAAGAALVYETRLLDLTRRADGRVDGVVVQDRTGATRRIAAGLVIGADGQKSAVARLTGARPYHVGAHAAGVTYTFWEGLGVQGYHWYYQPGASVGAIPTNDGLTCVFTVVPRDRFAIEMTGNLEAGYHDVLGAAAPDLAASVAGARRAEPFRGFPGQPGFFRQSWGPGWALVGDAGYFKDPFTAHGITDALRDAELLARAAVEGSEGAFARYQDVRDRLSRTLFDITDSIASFDWNLESLRELHRALSRELQQEASWLADLQGETAAAPLV